MRRDKLGERGKERVRDWIQVRGWVGLRVGVPCYTSWHRQVEGGLCIQEGHRDVEANTVPLDQHLPSRTGMALKFLLPIYTR